MKFFFDDNDIRWVWWCCWLGLWLMIFLDNIFNWIDDDFDVVVVG